GRAGDAGAAAAGGLSGLRLREPERLPPGLLHHPDQAARSRGRDPAAWPRAVPAVPRRDRGSGGGRAAGGRGRRRRPGAVGGGPRAGLADHHQAALRVGGSAGAGRRDPGRPAEGPAAPVKALAAAVALALTPAAALAGPRVASLDQCADQYVLALAPPETIAGVSPRADDPDSRLRAAARGAPRLRPTLEAVLMAEPQVVVRYWGGDPRPMSTGCGPRSGGWPPRWPARPPARRWWPIWTPGWPPPDRPLAGVPPCI